MENNASRGVSPLPFQDILPRLLRHGWSSDDEAAHALVMQSPPGAMDPDFVMRHLCDHMCSDRAPSRYVTDQSIARLDDIACWALDHGANPALRMDTSPEDVSKTAPVLAWLLSSTSILPRAVARLLHHPDAAQWLGETFRGQPLDANLLRNDRVQVLEDAAAAGLRPSHGQDGTMAWEMWVPSPALHASALRASANRLMALGWLPESEAAYKEAVGRMMKKSRPPEARNPDKMKAVGKAMGLDAKASNASIVSSLLTLSIEHKRWGSSARGLSEEAKATLKNMNEREAFATLAIKRAGSQENWSPAAAMIWAILVTHSKGLYGVSGLSLPGTAMIGQDVVAMVRALPPAHPARTAIIGTRKGHAFSLNGLLLLAELDSPSPGIRAPAVTQALADDALGAFLAIAPSLYEQAPDQSSMNWRSAMASNVIAMLAPFIDPSTHAVDASTDPAWLADAWLDVAGVRCESTRRVAWYIADQAAIAASHCQSSPLGPRNPAWVALAGACAGVRIPSGTPSLPDWLPKSLVQSTRPSAARDLLVSRAREDASTALDAFHIEDCPSLAALLPPAQNPPSAAVWLDAEPQGATSMLSNTLRTTLLTLAWSCASMGKDWLATKLVDRRRTPSTKERDVVEASIALVAARNLYGPSGFSSTKDPHIALAFAEMAARTLFAVPNADLMSSSPGFPEPGRYLATLFHCANLCAAHGLDLSTFARTAMAEVLGPNPRDPHWNKAPSNNAPDYLIGIGWANTLELDPGFHPAQALAWLGAPIKDPDARFGGIVKAMTETARSGQAKDAARNMASAEANRRLAAAPSARPRVRA